MSSRNILGSSLNVALQTLLYLLNYDLFPVDYSLHGSKNFVSYCIPCFYSFTFFSHELGIRLLMEKDCRTKLLFKPYNIFQIRHSVI